MKKSITKRLLTIAMAATLCLSSSIYAYSAIGYTVGLSTTPYYGDNRNLDIFANTDKIISALYASNGTNMLQKIDIAITDDDKQAHAVGQIIDTILDCNSSAFAATYPNVEKLSLYKISEHEYTYESEGYHNDSTYYYYIGWRDTEDHTTDIDNIKVALEEARRIASTVPEGTNEQKLRYIYDYIVNGTTIDYTNSSLYDTLILKRGCCRGKSAAVYIISQYAGLPVGLMEYKTNKNVGHSANYMYYEDGTIKYVDAAAGRLFLSDHYYND